MTIFQRRFGIPTTVGALCVVSLVAGIPVASAAQMASAGFPLRNQNPFLQIFGLPPAQSANLAPEGSYQYDLSLDLANHADAADNDVEDFAIDGESYFLNLSWRHGFSERLELGIDVPLVGHRAGILDNAIERWHDIFGLSNTKRRGPSNQLGFRYSRDGNTLYELSSPTFGIGDVQLTAAIPVKVARDNDRRSVAVRSSIKLPTGNVDKLHGSGGTDFAIGVYAADKWTFWRRDLEVSGFAGVLLLGDSDVLAGLERGAVPYGGIAGTWWVTDNFGISSQLNSQAPYVDSDLRELGGNSVQLAVGADWRLPRRGLSLLFAVVEDVSANATTDFALHFSVRKRVGQ